MSQPHPRFRPNETPAEALTRVADCPADVKALLGSEGRQLLRQLCRKAPGTFFHSSRVLDLMQAAGHAQGTREIAAVLMHDVGKLFAPSMFAENAADDRGCPDPWVIAGHVNFGYQLARDAGLDDMTVQAILQHHGTQPVGQSSERYAGQLPSSAFTLALMMADTLEAAISAGPFTTQGIWRVHSGRLADGQMDLLDAWTCEDVTRSLVNAAEQLGWLGGSAAKASAA